MASLVKRGSKTYVVYQYTDSEGKRRQKWESYKTVEEEAGFHKRNSGR